MPHPAPGLLPRGALLRNAVPAPDRGSVAAPPTAPEKLRSARSGPSSSSGVWRASTSEEGCLGLFSQAREFPLSPLRERVALRLAGGSGEGRREAPRPLPHFTFAGRFLIPPSPSARAAAR